MHYPCIKNTLYGKCPPFFVFYTNLNLPIIMTSMYLAHYHRFLGQGKYNLCWRLGQMLNQVGQ